MTFQTWAVLLLVAICLSILLRKVLAAPRCDACKGGTCVGRRKRPRRRDG